MTRPDTLSLRAQAHELRQRAYPLADAARVKFIEWRSLHAQASRLIDEGIARQREEQALRAQARSLLERARACDEAARAAEQADRWERRAAA